MSQIHHQQVSSQSSHQTTEPTAQATAEQSTVQPVSLSLQRLRRRFWLIDGVALLLFGIAYLAFPSMRDTFLFSSAEGQLIEVLALVFYAIGFIWGVRALLRLPKPNRWRYLAIPILSFFGFWDELSFTESVLRIPAMRIYGVRFDAFHDVIEIAYIVGQEHRWILHGLVGLIIGCLVLIGLKHRQIWRFLVSYPAYQFVAIAALLLIIPTTIDVMFPLNAALNHFEGLLETSAALAFVFAAACIGEVRSKA